MQVSFFNAAVIAATVGLASAYPTYYTGDVSTEVAGGQFGQMSVPSFEAGK